MHQYIGVRAGVKRGIEGDISKIIEELLAGCRLEDTQGKLIEVVFLLLLAVTLIKADNGFLCSGDSCQSLCGRLSLLLSGGGDVSANYYGGDESVSRDVNPARDAFELELLAMAEARNLPVLGLCRGAQLLNVHRGGTLGDFRQDSARYRRHKRVWGGHPVTVENGSRLADILSTTALPSVVTWHGQYVERPGTGVRITAYAPDGTPEAIEVATGDPFGMIGVQWHAEVLPWDRRQDRLFAAFHDAAARSRSERSRQ